MSNDYKSVLDFILKALKTTLFCKDLLIKIPDTDKNFVKAKAIASQLHDKINEILDNIESKFPENNIKYIKRVPDYEFAASGYGSTSNLDDIIAVLELSIPRLEDFLKTKQEQVQKEIHHQTNFNFIQGGLGRQIIALLSNHISFGRGYDLIKFCDENGLDQSYFLDSSDLGSYSISAQTHALLLHLDQEGEYEILNGLIKEVVKNDQALESLKADIGTLLEEKRLILDKNGISTLRKDLTNQIQVYKSHGAREVPNNLQSNRIFIVHGHDDGMKETVCRRLEKIGLKPVILHEQPDLGRT